MPKPLLAVIILMVSVGSGYFIFREEPENEEALAPKDGEEEQRKQKEENGQITENVIQTEINGVFSIELESNPTTGYGWQAEFSKESLELVQNIYLPSEPETDGKTGNEPLVGSTGKEIFEFKALQSGKTEITFSYLRPWEQGVEPIKQEIYEVEISGEEPFCGWSTMANCESDKDCKTGGCSGQVCQPASEENAITTCEYRDCYNAKDYDLSCVCQGGICQWAE